VQSFNPKQTVLFPDLFQDANLPSITTLPEFDRALSNFIQLADFGAFIDLSLSGIDKSFSLQLHEMRIPRRFLARGSNISSPVFHLFPQSIRNELKRFSYEVRAFFGPANSIKTPVGYFLFRNFFHRWDLHRKKVTDQIHDYLDLEIGPDRYTDSFVRMCEQGQKWILSHLKRRHLYEKKRIHLDLLIQHRNRLAEDEITISQLDRNSSNFLFDFLLLKSMHVPATFAEYAAGISIVSTFKTIHLEYLTDIQIETTDDIKDLVTNLQR